VDEGKVLNILLKYKLINLDQAHEARERARTTKQDVIKVLEDLGYVTQEQFLKVLSREYKIHLAEIPEDGVDPSVLQLVPADFARKNNVFPLKRKGRILYVAVSDPTNIAVLDNLTFLTGHRVEPLLAPEDKIKAAIKKYYGEEDELSEVLSAVGEDEIEVIEEKEESEEVALQLAEEAPVVKFVNALIRDAVKKGASDIHIEPFEKEIRVRMRIDGTLHRMESPPISWKNAIVSRIKILSKLDIAERRLPQDGHIKMKMADGKTIDLRVSTLPTLFGEKVVMRILDKGSLQLDLTKLGFEPDSLKKFEYAITRPYGMILVTGPTGSGKTTTLYSALSKLNRPEVNIMTAEDPVEYDFPGINQVNVKEEIGLNFAAALRAFLRQDPDIIMVGEIRDEETASIAVKAALTGHLVLSTLHTNDAPSTIARLIDMGVPPYLIADSLILVLAQRLIRKLCPKCKKPFKPSPERLKMIGLTPKDIEGYTVYTEGEGCVECNGTKYKGREGVYEVMLVTPTIREMILDERPIHEIRERAIEEGMLTLREAAVLKFIQGKTSIEEVLRATMEG